MGEILRNQLIFWGPLALWMIFLFAIRLWKTDRGDEPTQEPSEKQVDEKPDCA